MGSVRLTELIKNYLTGKATEKEASIVEEWYEAFDDAPVEFENNKEQTGESAEKSWFAIRQKIAQIVPERNTGVMHQKGKIIYKMYPWVAAATVGLLFFVLFNNTSRLARIPEIVTNQTGEEVQQDILPGGDKAVLALSTGRQIILDSADNGLLAVEGAVKIIKVQKGLLTLQPVPDAGPNTRANGYNTIYTPKGGKYQIVLPDGSKVFMNAATSMKFPAEFSGLERRVEIKGEAFFEIARDERKPFIVERGNVAVKVLGTKFNLSAYEDETDLKVTLVEGSVSVEQSDILSEKCILKPGEQIRINGNGQRSVIENANIEEAVAWKNNLFWFEDSDIYDVAKTLSRWYNVTIEIKDTITDRFTGSIPMDLTFSKVIGMLQKTAKMQYKSMGHGKIILSR